MRKSYLFVYNDIVGTREAVRQSLDKMRTVLTWRYDMPNVFYLVSGGSAYDLAREFEAIHGNNGRFIFLEYSPNSQGRLTEESWHLLNATQHKPEK